MLAVAPEAQSHGIGHALKEFQREYAIQIGAHAIQWTFDPLVARNAHFNLNVLGVEIAAYVPDMYGESASPLHRGIGTDRFIVSWPVDDTALVARRRAIAISRERPTGEYLRLEVPADIGLLQRTDMAAARNWRMKTRAAIQEAMANGFVFQGFQRGRANGATNGYYVLEREE
jgi:predicted GNAT superfamily acetyltransferase